MIMPDTKTQNEILNYMVHILCEDKPLEYRTELIKECSAHIITEKFKRTQFPKMNIVIKHQ